MNKKTIVEIVKVIATAIVTIVTMLLAESCTITSNLAKGNSKIDNKVEQTLEVDSTSINTKIK